MTKTLHIDPAVVGGPNDIKQQLDAESSKQVSVKSELEQEVGGKVHYGHAHARTSQLYQERRAQFEMKKRLEATQAAQAKNSEAKASEDTSAEASASESAEAFGTERVKEMALEAVKSVVGAAREAVHGHPLVGARKLAGDAVSGALKVAREVKARAHTSDKEN